MKRLAAIAYLGLSLKFFRAAIGMNERKVDEIKDGSAQTFWAEEIEHALWPIKKETRNDQN